MSLNAGAQRGRVAASCHLSQLAHIAKRNFNYEWQRKAGRKGRGRGSSSPPTLLCTHYLWLVYSPISTAEHSLLWLFSSPLPLSCITNLFDIFDVCARVRVCVCACVQLLHFRVVATNCGCNLVACVGAPRADVGQTRIGGKQTLVI